MRLISILKEGKSFSSTDWMNNLFQILRTCRLFHVLANLPIRVRIIGYFLHTPLHFNCTSSSGTLNRYQNPFP